MRSASQHSLPIAVILTAVIVCALPASATRAVALCGNASEDTHRVAADESPHSLSSVRQRNDALTENIKADVRAPLSFNLHLPMVADPTDIQVALRIARADRVVSLPTNAVAHPVDTSDLHTIVVDANDLDLSDLDSIGILTTVLNRDDQVQYAYAFVAPITDSFHLNQDGSFDVQDQILAVEKFTKNELDMQTMNRILEAQP